MALLGSRVTLSSGLKEPHEQKVTELAKEKASEGEVKPDLAAALRDIPFFRGQGPVYCRQSDCIMG